MRDKQNEIKELQENNSRMIKEAMAVETASSSETPAPVARMAATRAARPEPDMIPREYVEAPYHNDYKKNETVSLNSGALQLAYTDVSLPGKNGFDLNIQRIYDSTTAGTTYAHPAETSGYFYGQSIYHFEPGYNDLAMKYDYFPTTTKLEKRIASDGFDNRSKYWRDEGTYTKIKRLKTVGRPNDHFVKLFGLGYGWRFNIASIEHVAPVNDNLRPSYYLHLADGRSISIIRKDSQWQFEDYKENDITLTFPGGEWLVTHRNGQKDHFISGGYESGYLLASSEDKFGQRINYSYTNGRLSSITDTMGRVLILKETVSGTTKTLYWQQGSSGDILCKYTVQNNLLTDARTVAKAGSERITSYRYTPLTSSTRLFGLNSDTSDEYISITFQTVTAVTHPTGAKTVYTYSAYSNQLPSSLLGMFGSIKLDSRKDYPTPSTVQHEETYTYAFGMMQHSQTQLENNGDESDRSSYIKTATVEYRKNGVTERKVVSNFEDKHGQLASEETYHLIGGTETLVFKRELIYEFQRGGNRKLPVSEKQSTYNPTSGSFKLKSMTWAYDSKDNVIDYAEIYQRDEANNQSVTMAYDLTYSQMTSKTVQNTAGSIKEEYMLDSAKRLITEKRVFDGTVLKERTGYEYDGQNRLIRERRYFGMPLDSTQECYATEFTYGSYSPDPIRTRSLGVKDAEGNLVAPSDPADVPGTVKQTSTYDWFGRTISQTDGNGNSTTTEYDGLGRVVKQTNPDGSFKAMVYDDASNRIIQTDELGYRSQFDYTPFGKISREVLLDGQSQIPVAAFSYDHLQQQILQIVYAEDGTVKTKTELAYDLYGNVASKIMRDAGNTELFRETSLFEPVVQSKHLRVTKTVSGDANAPNIVTVTLIDQLDRTVSETIGVSTTTYEFDKLGNKVLQTNPRNTNYKSRWTYDYAGRVILETSAMIDEIASEYDALGNKVKVIDPKGNETRFTYDALGRLLLQDAPHDGEQRAITRYFYDAAGNVVKQDILYRKYQEDDLTWNTTVHVYDNRNRVTDTFQYKYEDERYGSHFAYDFKGNLLSVSKGIFEDGYTPAVAAAVTAYTYDRFGNILTATDPAGHVERFTYNRLGRLMSKIDPNGNLFTFSYDSMDRLLSESSSKDGVTVSRSYTYTKTGQKLSESNDVLTVTNLYDAQGRLIQQSESNGIVKAYTYDEANNRTGFTLARDGVQEINLGYTYDRVNRLASVSRNGITIALCGYDENGNRSGVEYPESHILIRYTYNDANLVTEVANRKESTVDGKITVMTSFQYQYSLDGNQTQKKDETGYTTSYTYDRLGNLTEEAIRRGASTAYKYDRFFNRSKMTVSLYSVDDPVVDYTYDEANRLVSEVKTVNGVSETTTYTYDANGNQLTKTTVDGTETRTYNGFGQLTSLTGPNGTASYSYRPNGLRHQKVTGSGAAMVTHTHVWDGQNIVAEIGATNTIVARYLRGLSLLAREQDGALQYYTFNAHGDVTQRYDANCNLLKAYKYDAFGVEENPEPLDSNPFRYCGEYFDRETGTYYLRARSYNPATGRFTQEDSAKDGLNWYTYCANNPVRLIDPSGLKSEKDNFFKEELKDKFTPKDSKTRQEKKPLSGITGRENFYDFMYQYMEDTKSLKYAPDWLKRIIDQKGLVSETFEFPTGVDGARAFYLDLDVVSWKKGLDLLSLESGLTDLRILGKADEANVSIGANQISLNVGGRSLEALYSVIPIKGELPTNIELFGNEFKVNGALHLGAIGAGAKFEKNALKVSFAYGIGGTLGISW